MIGFNFSNDLFGGSWILLVIIINGVGNSFAAHESRDLVGRFMFCSFKNNFQISKERIPIRVVDMDDYIFKSSA